MTNEAAEHLLALMAGDTTHLEAVLRTPHDALEAAAHHLPALTVTSTAAARILDALLRHAITPERAGQWASFVRHGYAPQPSSTPITPLEIEYEAAHEDAIADAISRLDDIGDRIDGSPSREEFALLRARLLEHLT